MDTICIKRFPRWPPLTRFIYAKIIRLLMETKEPRWQAPWLVFLDINGYEFHCKDETLYGKIMNLATGDVKKEELIQFYEKHSKKK